jgi:hypothetical protein
MKILVVLFVFLLIKSCKAEFKDECYLDIGKLNFNLVSEQNPAYFSSDYKNLGLIIDRVDYDTDEQQYFRKGDILMTVDNCGIDQSKTGNGNNWPKMNAVLMWPKLIEMDLIKEIEIIRNNRRLRLYGPRLTKIQILLEDVK